MDNLKRSSYWDGDNRILHVNYERCNINEDTSHVREERNLFTCCDSNLNFSTATCSEDDSEFGTYKKNKRQDPMSHRIIEKRRRDRMNNCLADLSRLIPIEYLKKGRGRIEKTEIIEMAIKHMKFLQQDTDPNEQYKLGYQECMSETMRFMVEVEGHFSTEAICVRLLNHLQKHCASLTSHKNVHNLPQTVPNTIVEDKHQTPPPIEVIEPISMSQEKREYHHYQNGKEEDDNKFTNNVHEAKDSDHHSSLFLLGNYSTASHHHQDETEMFENNKISYKYKTNIKLRFNQDNLNGNCNDAKRMKSSEGIRRNSINSSSQNNNNSPPASEMSSSRISSEETTNRTSSPSDSMISSNINNNINHSKLSSTSSNETTNSFSGTSSRDTFPINNINNCAIKHFKVPIFALHSKGSFYVPLTVDYKALLPYLNQNYISNLLMDDGSNPLIVSSGNNNNNFVLHPVMINVNFQSNFNTNNNEVKQMCNLNNFPSSKMDVMEHL